MRTKNGHDISIERPSPYGGPAYGCRRCGWAGVYTGSSPSDEAIIESIEAGAPCKPTQLTLDQERGKHACQQMTGRTISWDDGFCVVPLMIDKMPNGTWLCRGEDSTTLLCIVFCPFCGVKLGDLPPVKPEAGA